MVILRALRSLRLMSWPGHEPSELAHPHAYLSRAVARGRAADEIRGASDSRRAEGNRRRGHLRSRLAYRLAGRVPGETAEGGDGVRAGHRSTRRQAADYGGAHLAGAARARNRVDGGHHRR